MITVDWRATWDDLHEAVSRRLGRPTWTFGLTLDGKRLPVDGHRLSDRMGLAGLVTLQLYDRVVAGADDDTWTTSAQDRANAFLARLEVEMEVGLVTDADELQPLPHLEPINVSVPPPQCTMPARTYPAASGSNDAPAVVRGTIATVPKRHLPPNTKPQLANLFSQCVGQAGVVLDTRVAADGECEARLRFLDAAYLQVVWLPIWLLRPSRSGEAWHDRQPEKQDGGGWVRLVHSSSRPELEGKAVKLIRAISAREPASSQGCWLKTWHAYYQPDGGEAEWLQVAYADFVNVDKDGPHGSTRTQHRRHQGKANMPHAREQGEGHSGSSRRHVLIAAVQRHWHLVEEAERNPEATWRALKNTRRKWADLTLKEVREACGVASKRFNAGAPSLEAIALNAGSLQASSIGSAARSYPRASV